MDDDDETTEDVASTPIPAPVATVPPTALGSSYININTSTSTKYF